MSIQHYNIKETCNLKELYS